MSAIISYQQKITDKWFNAEKQWGLIINADNSIGQIKNGTDLAIQGATWAMNQEPPFVLKISQDKKVIIKMIIEFINEDQIKVTRQLTSTMKDDVVLTRIIN